LGATISLCSLTAQTDGSNRQQTGKLSYGQHWIDAPKSRSFGAESCSLEPRTRF